jgi:hypothetical protein
MSYLLGTLSPQEDILQNGPPRLSPYRAPTDEARGAMFHWRKDAIVWVNHPERGRVLIGPFGFAWWEGRRVKAAAFPESTAQLMAGFIKYKDWDSVRVFETSKAPLTSVLRFVRSGLWPAQGKLA